MFERIKQLTRKEAPSKETQEFQEEKVDRLHTKVEEIESRQYKHYPGSPLYHWQEQLKKAEEKLDEMKGSSQEEAERLDDEFKKLKKKAEEALRELEEFKVNKLGMNEGQE